MAESVTQAFYSCSRDLRNSSMLWKTVTSAASPQPARPTTSYINRGQGGRFRPSPGVQIQPPLTEVGGNAEIPFEMTSVTTTVQGASHRLEESEFGDDPVEGF